MLRPTIILPARTKNIRARSVIRRQIIRHSGLRYGGSSITNDDASPLNTTRRSTHAATNAITVPIR